MKWSEMVWGGGSHWDVENVNNSQSSGRERFPLFLFSFFSFRFNAVKSAFPVMRRVHADARLELRPIPCNLVIWIRKQRNSSGAFKFIRNTENFDGCAYEAKRAVTSESKERGKKGFKKGKDLYPFFSFPIDRGVENKYKSRFDGRQEELHKNKCLLPWKKTREKLL